MTLSAFIAHIDALMPWPLCEEEIREAIRLHDQGQSPEEAADWLKLTASLVSEEA